MEGHPPLSSRVRDMPCDHQGPGWHGKLDRVSLHHSVKIDWWKIQSVSKKSFHSWRRIIDSPLKLFKDLLENQLSFDIYYSAFITDSGFICFIYSLLLYWWLSERHDALCNGQHSLDIQMRRVESHVRRLDPRGSVRSGWGENQDRAIRLQTRCQERDGRQCIPWYKRFSPYYDFNEIQTSDSICGLKSWQLETRAIT